MVGLRRRFIVNLWTWLVVNWWRRRRRRIGIIVRSIIKGVGMILM